MSKISEQLVKYAQEEKQTHQEYIADFTATTIAHLMDGGVAKDKAVFLAKEACLRNEELVKSINRALILEKTAQYIEALEDENVKLAAKISTSPVEKQADMSEPLKKLASIGLTPEEIEAMKDVPEKILEKIANTGGDPWELGRGVGPSVPKSDPLLDWILQ